MGTGRVKRKHLEDCAGCSYCPKDADFCGVCMQKILRELKILNEGRKEHGQTESESADGSV